MTNEELPLKWGTSAAKFYARCEGEEITLHLQPGETLTGSLVGVDKYDLFLERQGKVILVAKHMVSWIEPGSQPAIGQGAEIGSPAGTE